MTRSLGTFIEKACYDRSVALLDCYVQGRLIIFLSCIDLPCRRHAAIAVQSRGLPSEGRGIISIYCPYCCTLFYKDFYDLLMAIARGPRGV